MIAERDVAKNCQVEGLEKGGMKGYVGGGVMYMCVCVC